MAQECGFFNAELSGDTYDRVYTAEQFAAYFASFIGNGVFGNSMDELVVLEKTENDMSVDVSTGQAWINGWWYRNTDTYNLSIGVADGTLNRIDVVVLRWGSTERDMWLQVIQGESSEEPTAPSISRDADYYDLKLCEISVPAGATEITQSQITDTRLDTDVCGFVTGVVDQIDTSELYLQFNSQFSDFMETNYEDFDTWFQEMKDQLSEDAAGHLQSEIEALDELEYTSADTEETPTETETVELLTSGETAVSRWVKVSQMFKNIRYALSQITQIWSTIEDVSEQTTAYSFGTASALTFQTAYTMEHDAMIQFKIPTTSSSGGTRNRGLVYVNGILAIQMETPTSFPTTVSLFVRKGSVVTWDATYSSSYGSCFRRYLV